MNESNVFQFNYEPVQGQRLERAEGSAPVIYDDGGVGYDSIRLILERCCLLMTVDDDTDEVFITLENKTEVDGGVQWRKVAFLDGYIGSEIGWLWRARNWMGYADMIALSLSGIDPKVAIVGAASKLSLYRIDRLG
jgi:hypothetical protein